MMFAKEAEPFVPKHFHTWLCILTQWKNAKERNSEPDRSVKSFCPYFTTEGSPGAKRKARPGNRDCSAKHLFVHSGRKNKYQRVSNFEQTKPGG